MTIHSMKLEDFIEVVKKIADRLGRAQMNVGICSECKEPKYLTQESHALRHCREAFDLLEEIPYSVRWGKNMTIKNDIVKTVTENIIINVIIS